MKWVKKSLQCIVVVLVLFLGLVAGGGLLLAMKSHTAPSLGPVDGHLRVCPVTPNCVCSQSAARDSLHAVAPLGRADWQVVRRAIEAAGGRIGRDDGHYLHATFRSSLFHFVDDVEVLRDAQGLLQIRSASRVGRSDLGVNRKRVEAIRAKLK
jgi:uncharacterized protein (DUF1499 family)